MPEETHVGIIFGLLIASAMTQKDRNAITAEIHPNDHFLAQVIVEHLRRLCGHHD